ncbi:hypothetical protein E2C01_094715 [Portunus trituberculatus]|uniref:Uncharacterized protein n=1 Tax=Portunus trituberculatus TaxID=210409 RepID=A0A5B7JWV8_PORTR|nr:hypothetical protein [Portunus trituberculatus]
MISIIAGERSENINIMMKVTRKQKGHKKKKKRPSDRESTASSVAHLISALFFGIP